MRKIILTITSILLIMVCSCYEETVNNRLRTVSLELTFTETENDSKSIPANYILQTGSDLDYKDAIKNGTLEYSTSPDVFYMAINQITLYNPEDPADPTSGIVTGVLGDLDAKNKRNQPSPNGGCIVQDIGTMSILEPTGIEENGGKSYIPNRLNMLNSKNILAGLVDKYQSWGGVFFDCFIGEGTVNNFYIGARVGIKKSTFEDLGIPEHQIANKLNDFGFHGEDLDDYIWFSTATLNPFKENSVSSQFYILFQSGITSPMIYTSNSPYSFSEGSFGPAFVSANATFIALPCDKLDFSNYSNPEFELSVNTENLIQIYSHGGQYWVYFNKDNPYPYNLEVRESSYGAVTSSAVNTADRSLLECIKYLHDDTVILQWVRPSGCDVNRVEIYYSDENNVSTARKIAESRSNVFLHQVGDAESSHYYWACFIDSNGNHSQMKQFEFCN